jgi:hypothetical protein
MPKLGQKEQKPWKHAQIPQRTPWLNFMVTDVKKMP